MPPRWPDASFAILAGGAGTRLGGLPKGMLRLQGRTFLDRLLDFRAAFTEAFVVSNDQTYSGLGVRVVPDVLVGKGAPGGVHAALKAAKTEWVFVSAVDLPLLTMNVIAALALKRSDAHDVVCYQRQGLFEPLAAFYRRSVAEELEKRLASGEPSMQELLSALRVFSISEKELKRIDETGQALLNVNTPEDLVRIGATRPSAR